MKMIRRAVFLAASLVLAVGLAACGSGGGTSSGDATTDDAQTSAEAAWAKGVQQQVADFVTHAAPSHLGTHDRVLIQMGYELKSSETRSAFYEVEGVPVPAACKGAQGEILDAIEHLGKETEKLVGRQDLSQEEYASLYDRQADKVDEAGRELVDLTSSLAC